MTAPAPVMRAWIGLGSNLEGPAQQIERTIHLLTTLPETRLLRRSRLYRTPPWGRTDQPMFVNAVAELETGLSAEQLLTYMLAIELAAGRSRDVPRWGPRVIDLDLLVYGDQRSDRDGLRIPHPQLAQRAFVLVPLAELAPELEIIGLGRADELLARIDAHDRESILPLEPGSDHAE